MTFCSPPKGTNMASPWKAQYGWNTSPNNARYIPLSEVVYMSIIFHMPPPWLNLLNGYDFYKTRISKINSTRRRQFTVGFLPVFRSQNWLATWTTLLGVRTLEKKRLDYTGISILHSNVPNSLHMLSGYGKPEAMFSCANSVLEEMGACQGWSFLDRIRRLKVRE